MSEREAKCLFHLLTCRILKGCYHSTGQWAGRAAISVFHGNHRFVEWPVCLLEYTSVAVVREFLGSMDEVC